MNERKTKLNSIFFNNLGITFHRTLRIPDDKNTYALPPSMGFFPIHKTLDFIDTIPENWKKENGFFIPMYQREAMWIGFSQNLSAVQIGIGKINAISGTSWDDKLNKNPQNYLVAPYPQRWIDGIKTESGAIRQFIAMPLGDGYTVEGQVTGKEEFGGIQIAVFRSLNRPIKKHLKSGYGDNIKIFNCSYSGELEENTWSGKSVIRSAGSATFDSVKYDSGVAKGKKASEMGLGAGGKMYQKIYPDPHGLDFWDLDSKQTAWFYICNIPLFQKITGLPAPECPIDASHYTAVGYPWFDLYDENYSDVEPTDTLKKVESVSELDGIDESGDSFNIPDSQVKKYHMQKKVYGSTKSS
ncbi:MAG: hypothetical protein ACFFCZ_20330 [Promethearchaeota archaeon]